jgi:hypothetical protein
MTFCNAFCLLLGTKVNENARCHAEPAWLFQDRPVEVWLLSLSKYDRNAKGLRFGKSKHNRNAKVGHCGSPPPLFLLPKNEAGAQIDY